LKQRISASVRQTFIELLVPAGLGSSRCHAKSPGAVGIDRVIVNGTELPGTAR
jgi:hypothetical protein